MSRGDGLRVENLDKWIAWLNTLQAGEIDQFKSRVLRSAALAGLEVAQDNTPRRTSRLAQSESMGARDNYFKLTIGKTSFVVFGTNVEYAAAIENGFSQANRKGDFVPGYWRGATFHYDPEASGGMVLTGAVIEGAHMFKKALDALENGGKLEAITAFEFRRLYAELTK
jgi:hypothetical protein